MVMQRPLFMWRLTSRSVGQTRSVSPIVPPMAIDGLHKRAQPRPDEAEAQIHGESCPLKRDAAGGRSRPRTSARSDAAAHARAEQVGAADFAERQTGPGRQRDLRRNQDAMPVLILTVRFARGCGRAARGRSHRPSGRRCRTRHPRSTARPRLRPLLSCARSASIGQRPRAGNRQGSRRPPRRPHRTGRWCGRSRLERDGAIRRPCGHGGGLGVGLPSVRVQAAQHDAVPRVAAAIRRRPCFSLRCRAVRRLQSA